MDQQPTQDQPPVTPAPEAAINNQPMTAPTPGTAPAPVTSVHKGLAIAAMIVGIFAFLLGIIPFLGFILGVTAVVFGAIGLKHKESKGMAISGIVLGGLGTLASIVTSIMLFIGFSMFATMIPWLATNIHTNADGSVSLNSDSSLATTKEFAKGTTATFGDYGVKINSVTRNFAPTDDFDKAAGGNELIVLNISVTNNGSEELYFSKYNLDVIEGSVTDYLSLATVDSEFESNSIAAGATITGNIVFEVTKDATDLKLRGSDISETSDTFNLAF